MALEEGWGKEVEGGLSAKWKELVWLISLSSAVARR